jgi:hypothetical protein
MQGTHTAGRMDSSLTARTDTRTATDWLSGSSADSNGYSSEVGDEKRVACLLVGEARTSTTASSQADGLTDDGLLRACITPCASIEIGAEHCARLANSGKDTSAKSISDSNIQQL